MKWRDINQSLLSWWNNRYWGEVCTQPFFYTSGNRCFWKNSWCYHFLGNMQSFTVSCQKTSGMTLPKKMSLPLIQTMQPTRWKHIRGLWSPCLHNWFTNLHGTHPELERAFCKPFSELNAFIVYFSQVFFMTGGEIEDLSWQPDWDRFLEGNNATKSLRHLFELLTLCSQIPLKTLFLQRSVDVQVCIKKTINRWML